MSDSAGGPDGTERRSCFSCGAVVPLVEEGPTHDFMLSSPGCWKLYGEVLAREYQDAAYMANHRLTVDAYAVQHPGEPTPASARSVLFHLISLYAVLERGVSPASATGLLQRLGEGSGEVEWLEPPESPGDVTVADVHGAEGAAEHLDAVERWARSAWEAWSPYHPMSRERLDRLMEVDDGRR